MGMGAKLKIIRQTEATECGLACIAMIGNGLGHDIGLAAMRERSGVSLRGSTLAHLAAIAKDLGLNARGLRAELDDLRKFESPVILHWDMNHFVVLEQINGQRARIIDPARGRVTLGMDELSAHFTGAVLELTRADDFVPVRNNPRLSLRHLLKGVQGLRPALTKVLILSVLFQISILALPFFIQLIVDRAIPLSDTGLVLALALGFAGVMIVRAGSEAARSWTVLTYGHDIAFQIMQRALTRLLHLPVGYFEKRHVGDIISRMNSAQPLQQALTRDAIGVVIDLVMTLITLGVMIWVSPILAAIVVCTSLLALGFTVWFYPRLRIAQEAAIVSRANENSHVIESIRAAPTLKLFGDYGHRERRWSSLYADFVRSSVDYGGWQIRQIFTDRIIFGLQSVLIIGIGGWLLIEGRGQLTLGLLFAFIMFRQLFSDALSRVLSKGLELRLLGLHLERLADIWLAQEEIQPAAPANLPEKLGDIVLDKVSFRYSDADPWILKDVSLTLPAGKMSVITGPSGGGKTTLLKLLLGFYAPTAGDIRIGDVPLRKIAPEDWRARLGVVMQDDVLLSGTLADNISFFAEAPDRQRVIGSAKMAQIHDDIANMPMNYGSAVGDMGTALSGGQRQRVLLARAFYNNPDVLFLDEGTANLDESTEKSIAEIFSQIAKTRIIIAHRPAFLAKSDIIWTVKNSKVLQET